MEGYIMAKRHHVLKPNEIGFLKSNLALIGIQKLIQKYEAKYVEEVECIFTYVIYEFDTREMVEEFRSEMNRIVDLD